MLQLLKNNSPFTILILFIFALLIKLQALLAPVTPLNIPDAPAYNFLIYILNKILLGSAFAYTLLTAVLLFLQALYINAIATRHRLFAKNSFSAAYFYLLFTSLYPAFNYFSNILIANWFLLYALDVMFSFSQPRHPRKYVFNAGFLVAAAALFQFSAIFLFVLLIVALLLLRPFNFAEWTVAILGVFTVIYFFAGILFLSDSLYLFHHWYVIKLPQPYKPSNVVYISGLLTGYAIILLFAFIVLQMQIGKSSMFVRRSWSIITAYFIISLFTAFCTPVHFSQAWLIVLPPISLIAAQSFYLEKRKRFSNFMFYFSLLLLVFCQIAVNR